MAARSFSETMIPATANVRAEPCLFSGTRTAKDLQAEVSLRTRYFCWSLFAYLRIVSGHCLSVERAAITSSMATADTRFRVGGRRQDPREQLLQRCPQTGIRARQQEYQPASFFVHHMPYVTIELVGVEKSPHLKPTRFQVWGKLLAVDVTKLRPMPKIVGGFAEFDFGKFYLAEGLRAVRGPPKYIYVAFFQGVGHGFWLPEFKGSCAAKSSQ